MERKSKPKPDDPEQSKRFIETAKEHEADDPKALDRAFKKVAKPQNHQPRQKTTKTKNSQNGQ